MLEGNSTNFNNASDDGLSIIISDLENPEEIVSTSMNVNSRFQGRNHLRRRSIRASLQNPFLNDLVITNPNLSNDSLLFSNTDALLDYHSFLQNDINIRPNFSKIKQRYGRILFQAYEKLCSNELIFSSFVIDNIYKKITDSYYNYVKKSPQNTKAKTFIKCLPKLKYILKYTRRYDINDAKNYKDLFFCKMCLDIYEHYYQRFDHPTFNVNTL
jgi:hypothetical protein